jgi:hypothetical protein
VTHHVLDQADLWPFASIAQVINYAVAMTSGLNCPNRGAIAWLLEKDGMNCNGVREVTPFGVGLFKLEAYPAVSFNGTCISLLLVLR